MSFLFDFFVVVNLSMIKKFMGRLAGSVVESLPLAQFMIPGSWDRVPHQAPLEEPASPSAYVSASLCVSLMNKYSFLIMCY